MELLLRVEPNQQSIQFVDQTITIFADNYEIPNKRDFSFVVHELVINAFEAMQQNQFTEVKEIEVHVKKRGRCIKGNSN